MLKERPHAVAHVLLGLLNRSEVLLGLGGQLIHTS
jgi:hypothetical protein